MRQRRTFWLIVFLLFVLACNHEDYVRDYPQLVSIELKSNTASGVVVEAAMTGIHTDQVINHGFIWSLTLKDLVLPAPYGSGTSNKSRVVLLGKPDSDTFSTEIRSQLISKTKYFLRAFIQTDKTIVYGAPITFTSLGSDGPVIKSVSPTAISPGSIVTITGERFATDASQVAAWIKFTNGDSVKLTVQTSKDTEITALVPKNVLLYDGKIGVSIQGDGKSAFSDNITGNRPMLTSITATDLCSSFQLNGANLLMLGQPTAFIVNGMSFSPLPAITDNTITLSASFHNPTVNVTIVYGNNQITAKLTDPLPQPTVTSVPASFSPDNTFVVQGTGFVACDLQISPQSFDVGLFISDVTPTQFTVNVTYNTCTEFYPLVTFRNKVIYRATTSVKPPKRFDVTSISPLTGKVGDHITINGTGIDEVWVYMKGDYDTRVLTTTTQTTTQIDAMIEAPYAFDLTAHPDGDMTLVLEDCGYQEQHPFNLIVTPITVTGVSPAISDGTADFVITGTNFLSDPDINVSIFRTDNLPVLAPYPIKSITDTTITLYPLRNYTGTGGTMFFYIGSYGRLITSGTIQVQ